MEIVRVYPRCSRPASGYRHCKPSRATQQPDGHDGADGLQPMVRRQ